MSDKMVWDGLAKSRLKKLLAAKCSYREIAGILGCSPSAVGGQAHRLGLARQPAKGHRPRPKVPSQALPENTLFLDGQPLQFADTSPPCARCAVREDAHDQHGCGQFAGELRVRER